MVCTRRVSWYRYRPAEICGHHTVQIHSECPVVLIPMPVRSVIVLEPSRLVDQMSIRLGCLHHEVSVSHAPILVVRRVLRNMKTSPQVLWDRIRRGDSLIQSELSHDSVRIMVLHYLQKNVIKNQL